jgi:hypothetical protein
MPKHDKCKNKIKVMKPGDSSKPNGQSQFVPVEKVKKKLKMKDIFEMK